MKNKDINILIAFVVNLSVTFAILTQSHKLLQNKILSLKDTIWQNKLTLDQLLVEHMYITQSCLHVS